MDLSLSSCVSHSFADNLVAVMGGQLSVKYSIHCIDLEKRIKILLDQIEFYSCLSDQPINIDSTGARLQVLMICYFSEAGMEKILKSHDI